MGANKLEDFATLAVLDARMPCHMAVNYSRKDWETAQDLAPQCAGRGVFLSNTCKMPRDPAILKLPADHAAVFSNILQFREHHTR